MLTSFWFEDFSKIIDKDKLKKTYLTESKKICGGVMYNYCNLLGINMFDFEKDISFSLWDRIKGYN